MATVSEQEPSREQYSFVYGDEAVAYEVVRKAYPENKKRRIAIKVHPNCEVLVTAPHDATTETIHQTVMGSAKWIFAALTEFRVHLAHVQTKAYVSGEMQFYLGRRYVLKVIENPEALSSVKLIGGQLRVQLHCFDAAQSQVKAEQVKALLSGWYRYRAEQVFHQRLQALLPMVDWVTTVPHFRVLPMTKQWGSCSATGNLMLNPHLVKAPRECIDYVLLHELCHIAEHNHSEQFWRLLSGVMPHWREIKNRLDGMAELYLNE